jgi:diaminopimelate epimerase
MRLRFTKMQGLGNDFMLAEWPAGVPAPAADVIRRLADRRLGVGFDQLLLVTPSEPPAAGAYRVFNADGGEVEQCGNGARCVAIYLAPHAGTALTLASGGGDVEARVLEEGRVSVNLGVPDFRPRALPFVASEERDRYRLTLESGGEVEFGAVSMGNPHVVIAVHSVEEAPVGILGAELTTHPAFPRGVNVGFMQTENERRIRLRVFERGVGETLACGTGAAAAAAVGRRWGLLEEEVEVSLPGGEVNVRWVGQGSPLWQTGPTATVYEGQIDI